MKERTGDKVSSLDTMCQLHRVNYTCTHASRDPHAFHVLVSCPPRKAEEAGSFCPSPTPAPVVSSNLNLPCPLCNHLYYDLAPLNVNTTASMEDEAVALQRSLRRLDTSASQRRSPAGRSSQPPPAPRASPVRQPQSSPKPVKKGGRTGGSPGSQSSASPMKLD